MQDAAAVDLWTDASPDLASEDVGPGDALADGDGTADITSPDLGPPLGPLAQDDGRLWLGLSQAGGGPLALWSWQSATSSWIAEVSAPPQVGDVTYVLNKLLPTAELGLVKAVDGSSTVLSGYSWSAVSGWVTEFAETTSGTAHATKLDYDLAQEQSSGSLLLVYSDGSNTPRYRTRSQAGSWSAASPMPASALKTSGVVLWVWLVPRPGTNEIALLYADDQAGLGAAVWTGGQWDTASAQLLETDLKVNPTLSPKVVGNRTFDGAYETGTGQLVVAWGHNSNSGFYWAKRPAGGSWSGKSNVSVVGGLIEFVQLAADPASGSKKIAGTFVDLGNTNERLGLAIWDGGQWVGAQEYDGSIHNVNDKGTGDFPAAVAWVGTSGKAVCVYADSGGGGIDWLTSTGGGWTTQSDVAVAGKGVTESVRLVSFASRDEVLAVLSDDKSQVFTATYDGSAWTVASGMPLSASLSHTDAVPFSFALQP